MNLTKPNQTQSKTQTKPNQSNPTTPVIISTDDDIFRFDDPVPFFAWAASIAAQLPKVVWRAASQRVSVEQAASERMREIVVSWSPQPQ